ncbi:MAG: hypothetical protein ACOC0R_02910 [Mariniphaga sp.]
MKVELLLADVFNVLTNRFFWKRKQGWGMDGFGWLVRFPPVYIPLGKVTFNYHLKTDKSYSF